MTFIHPTAVVAEDTIIGKNCIIRENAVIGAMGSVITRDKNGILLRKTTSLPVIIGDNVDIGANVVIHRGSKINTKICRGTVIGSLCNIGHDVVIHRDCQILNMTCLSGFVTVGAHSILYPGTLVSNQIKIGARCCVGEGSLVRKDVPDKTLVVGRPAKKHPMSKIIKRRLGF